MAYRILKVSSRCKLETQLNYLVCRTEKDTRVLLDEIAVLIIENPQVCITGSLISELLAHKVRVIFCDQKHNPQGEISPYAGCFDAPAKLYRQLSWKKGVIEGVWKEIVMAKISNQISCMRRHGFPPERIAILEKYREETLSGDSNNREGQAARVYFNTIFGEGFDRRDELDSRNAYLNYGYSVLLGMVNREVSSYGYCNLLGIHHCGPTNEFNLGCDLVEPFRPFVDDFILSNKLNPDDFKKDMLLSFTRECRCGGRTMLIQNAVGPWCLSVFSALNGGKVDSLLEIGFEDGGVGI